MTAAARLKRASARARAERLGFRGAAIFPGVTWQREHADVRVGRGASIGAATRIATVGSKEHPAVFALGSRSSIGGQCVINCRRSIVIADGCQISWRVQILDSDFHQIQFTDGSVSDVSAPIRIEDHVWIGTGAIILKGVTLGSGSVIAAGSVVTSDVAPQTLVAGVPARFVKAIAGWR